MKGVTAEIRKTYTETPIGTFDFNDNKLETKDPSLRTLVDKYLSHGMEILVAGEVANSSKWKNYPVEPKYSAVFATKLQENGFNVVLRVKE